MRRLSVRFRPVAPAGGGPVTWRGLLYSVRVTIMDSPAIRPTQQHTVIALASTALTVIVVGTAAFALFLGLLTRFLPQMPTYVYQTPQAQTWLLQVAPRYPFLVGGSLESLFYITRTSIFRGLLLVLVFVPWLHIGYALYLAFWPRRGTAVPPLTPQATESSGVRQVTVPFRDLQAQTQRHLERNGLVAVEHPSFDETRFFIRQSPWAIGASVLAYVGLALVGLGIYMATTFGWETPPVILAPEQPWDIGHGTGLRLTLLDRQVATPPDAEVFFVQYLAAPERNVVRAIQPGQKFTLNGLTLHYLDNALGLALRVQDPAGTPLPLQPPGGRTANEMTLLFPTSGSEEIVLLPTLGYQLRAVGYAALPERGYTTPVILLQVIDRDGKTTLYSAFLADSQQISVKGLLINARLVPHARVQVTAYPGRRIAWAGALGFLVGALWSCLRGPFRRWWIRLQEVPRGTVVQVWGDMYNMGRHRPLRAQDLWTWLHYE